MIDFIRKTINPPGINKPNRLALFSAIGEVTEKVRADALKAFNAHFPYLADSVKLEEHGRALIIPRLAEDTENEFRGRVTAASFFLMRAGERAYVKDQMRSHFGDRFILKEEFLRVSVRIAELEDKDRQRAREFLDWILNPSISLAVAEWFCLAEELFPEEADAPAIVKNHTDRMYQGLCCDGRFLCDQGAETLCGGSLVCGGSWNCDDFQSVPGTVFDTFLESFFPTGAAARAGEVPKAGADAANPVFGASKPRFGTSREGFYSSRARFYSSREKFGTSRERF